MAVGHSPVRGTTYRPEPGWRQAVIGGLLLWAVARTVVAAISLLVLWLRQGPPVSDRAGVATVDAAGDGFFAALHHWDSNYLLRIASDGYFAPGSDPGTPGFFPGYSLVARTLSDLVIPGAPSLTVSLSALSSVASLIAAIVLWRIAAISSADRVAPMATLLFVAGPYSVFLYANYSESLFLAFATAAWYCGLRDRWVLAGLWCGLATATRINGIFLLVALLVMFVISRRRQHLPFIAPVLVWVPLAASGVIAYFGYLAVRTGDIVAWQTAQHSGWGREFSWPWEALYRTGGQMVFGATLDRRLAFTLDVVLGVLLVVAIASWIRTREWPSATYAGLTLLALTTSLTFVSLARNSLTVFPLAILIAGVLIRSRRNGVRAAVMAAWFGLFLLNTVLFACGYWVD